MECEGALREEYDFGVSEAAVGWYEEAGATRIADLVGRVVEPATAENVWMSRCQQVGE